MLSLFLLFSCTEPDPVLDPVKASLLASQRGEALLADGKAAEAEAAFAEAREHKEHPVLAAWQAQALAERGALEPAVALLGDVLVMAPELAVARYNRAAYLARLGRTEDAAAELSRAIADGAATAREAAADPDFAGLRGHPHFPFLPAALLEASVSVPEGTAFWGSELFIEATVTGAALAPVRFEGGVPEAPPLSLVRVVESVQPGPDPVRTLTWTVRVEGEGSGSLGPWTVHAGERSVEVPARMLEAAAPPGKAPATQGAWQWWVPSDLRGDREPPAVWQQDGALWVLTPAGGHVETEGQQPSLLLEQREGPSTQALIYRFDQEVPADQPVRITVGNELVFSGPPGE